MRNCVLQVTAGLLLFAAVLFSGCSPKNAEEFRKTLIVFHDNFEVERPYKDVAATLRKKNEECLHVGVRVICTNCIGNREMGKQVWTPTFVATAERTEVHLQLKRTDAIQVGAPPNGEYEIILDAIPLDKKRTRIDFYRLRPNTKFIQKAMTGWVQGNAEGCPDLSSTQ